MSDVRPALPGLGDEALGAELRALAPWLDLPTARVPAASPDPARRARLRIEAGIGRPRASWWPLGGASGRPMLRSLGLALVALVVLAAIVGAIGFGVPGIRIIFTGGGSPSPQSTAFPPASSPTASPIETGPPGTPGPPGSDLDLGFQTTPAEAPRLAGFTLELPTSSSLGTPDAIWFREGRISFVWKTRPGLPATQASGIGLVLTEFRGSVERAFFEKMLGPGNELTPVTVGDEAGYWISGVPHELVYLDPRGEIIADSRRVVGDTLIWTHGDLTFRLETSLGRAAAIGLAETIP